MPMGLGDANASSASYAHIPIPPIPVDAPGAGSSSFLEMSTRPNSVVEKRDKDGSSGDNVVEVHGSQAVSAGDAGAQGNGAATILYEQQSGETSSHGITPTSVAASTAVDQNVVIGSSFSVQSYKFLERHHSSSIYLFVAQSRRHLSLLRRRTLLSSQPSIISNSIRFLNKHLRTTINTHLYHNIPSIAINILS